MIIVSCNAWGRFEVGFAPTFYFGLKPLANKLSSSEKIGAIARQAADKYSFELVHVETVGSEKLPIFRVYIDKPQGISHDDCALVSHFVSEKLDADASVSPDYSLEVSSPGLERELYSLKDFEKFSGSLAKVKTNTAINGQRNFRGRIKTVEAEEIIFEDKTNGEVRFPFASVAKANLEIDIEEEFKRSDEL